jgi:hypothetical protein
VLPACNRPATLDGVGGAQALLRAEGVVLDADAEPADVLRACNAIATLGGAYARVHEQAELLPRLEAIEAAQAQQP